MEKNFKYIEEKNIDKVMDFLKKLYFIGVIEEDTEIEIFFKKEFKKTNIYFVYYLKFKDNDFKKISDNRKFIFDKVKSVSNYRIKEKEKVIEIIF